MNPEARFIREQISKYRWAARYVSYIDARDKGLKSKWVEELRQFAIDFQRQNPTERRRLILSVYDNLPPDTFNDTLIIPNPISKELFADEIKRWMKEEPRNSTAFTWSDKKEDLITAVRLDPQNYRAIRRYARLIMESVAFSQHELEHGYIGDPHADLADMERLTKMFEQLRDTEKVVPYKPTLEKYKQITIDYIAKHPDDHGMDLS